MMKREWQMGERAERNAEGTWVHPVFDLSENVDDAARRPCDVYGRTEAEATERARLIARMCSSGGKMNATNKDTIRDASEALRLAAAALRDLSRGWSGRELHEPIRTTAARAYRIMRRLNRMVSK